MAGLAALAHDTFIHGREMRSPGAGAGEACASGPSPGWPAGITKRVDSSCRAWTRDRAGRLYLSRRCPTACSGCVFDILDTVV